MSNEESGVILAVLSNPQNYGEATIREMNGKACKELARLWRMEAAVKQAAEHLTHVVSRPA